MTMTIVNIHQAKTNLSKLIEAVAQGEEIIIAKAGKPTAKLIPITHTKTQRTPGALKGQLTITADFNSPLPDDLLNDFEGK